MKSRSNKMLSHVLNDSCTDTVYTVYKEKVGENSARISKVKVGTIQFLDVEHSFSSLYFLKLGRRVFSSCLVTSNLNLPIKNNKSLPAVKS